MTNLPPGVRNCFLFLLLLSSLTNFVFAQQLSQDDCARRLAAEYYGLYDGIEKNSSNDTMKWCPWWAAACSYVHRNCRPAVSCTFTNFDPKITTRYDPTLSISFIPFQNCSSCSVRASLTSNNLLPGIVVPTQNFSSTGMLAPGEPPKDMTTEMSWVSKATSSTTIALIVGGFVGTIIAAWANKGASAAENTAYAAVAAAAEIPIFAANVASSLKDAILNSDPFVDAVTFLMQFQYISLTGLLSLNYPALYRFFTFNFGWANLIIPSAALKAAAEQLASRTQCLRNLGSVQPGSNGYSGMSGMDGADLRYGVNRSTLGGIVYISTIVGLAVAVGIFVVASLALRFVNLFAKSKRLESQIERWPAQVCNIGLRLINWVLAAVATFVFYQFVEPCGSRDLIAFGASEFIVIMLILLTVTILIVRTANREGPEALYKLSEREESVYSQKWGSLYSKLKPEFYWFFILDYLFTLTRSIIIGAGQGNGASQVGALIGLELFTLFSLSVKRPYQTSTRNFFEIFSTFRRLFASAALIVFFDGFRIRMETKRIVGMVIMVVESVYSAALFVFLLFNIVAVIVKLLARRNERKQLPKTDPDLTTPPEK